MANATIFINETGIIAYVINKATTNITGSLFLTLLGLIIIIIAFCILLRLPTEASAILVLPLLIVCMSFYSDFLAIGGALLIYLGFLLAKHFPINI